jgi:hypothetical protein
MFLLLEIKLIEKREITIATVDERTFPDDIMLKIFALIAIAKFTISFS